jgi:hypothetical protein
MEEHPDSILQFLCDQMYISTSCLDEHVLFGNGIGGVYICEREEKVK